MMLPRGKKHIFSMFLVLCLTFVAMSRAQYETYNFRNFPKEDLVPLAAAYGAALESYAAGNWSAAVLHLERSLRLHRLARDSARHCTRHCREEEQHPSFAGEPELHLHWRVLMGASCQKKCRDLFPALQLPPPGRLLMDEFSTRTPYRYLHHAHTQLNDLQKAVPCAYTFLQKNPEDQEMQQQMEEYKQEYDLSGYLTDFEERSYEAPFLKGVKLVGSGDYSSSIGHLEEALSLYLQEFDLCQADCEGIGQLPEDKDFYTIVADVYIDILRCKLKCEDNLTPNVGGYLVEKFVATIYHYLQYSYYKLNDGRSAVPCVYSYFLFQPDDQVMKHNLQYYKEYSQQWGLQSEYFTARKEASRHHNKTVTQKQMLTLAEKYLKLGVEDFLGAEEAAVLASESPDVEFEGVGDYEESIYANWKQLKGKGDVGQSNTEENFYSVNRNAG